MSHNRRNRNLLQNANLVSPKFGGLLAESASAVTAAVGEAKTAIPGFYNYSASGVSLEFIDDTTNGAALAVQLFTWPAAMIWVVSCLFQISVTAAGLDIEQDATLALGIGSAAYVADGGNPATTEIDMVSGLLSFDLVAGVKADQRVGSAAAHYVDGTAGTAKTYLNGYIADADIADDAAITADVDVKVVYFTL